MHDREGNNSLAIPVAAGLAVGILFIAAISIGYSLPAASNNAGAGNQGHNVLDRYQTSSEASAQKSPYALYIYLFKVDSSLQNQKLLEKLPGLYNKIENMTGITRPSQEAMLFTATRQGIYDPNGSLVTQLGPAKVIVSDGIVTPSGASVTESTIARNATFYIQPIAPSTLFMEDNGQFYAYHRYYYPNPKNIGDNRTVTAVEFAVSGADYEKFNSRYDQIKNIVESLR